MRSILTKSAAAGIALVTLAAISPSTAEAHSTTQSLLYLDVTEIELGGRVEMPLDDLRSHFGYALDGDEAEILDELRANQPEIGAYVADHMSVGSDGVEWAYEVTEVGLLNAEGGFALVWFLADVPGSEVPRRLDVFFDPFFDEFDGRDGLLLISNDWQAGVIDNGEEVLTSFGPDQRERTIDLGSASQWNNFTASLSVGVDHIRTGPDHILFVLVLLLPSVLVFTVMWKPVAGFGSSLWRILKIVSMFTLAHSITFVLAGLEVLPLPSSRIVESVIAASITVTALHNLHPVVLNREWMIAFVFGLFHGMGFASLIGALDLSLGTRMVSLLGRNLGIEIGQSVVVLLIFPALFLFRRTTWYRPIFVISSIVLAVLSFGWMIERLFLVDLRVGRFVDPVIEFPRSLVLVLATTVIAIVVHQTQQRSGRLLDTVDVVAGYPDDEPELVLSGSSDGRR